MCRGQILPGYFQGVNLLSYKEVIIFYAFHQALNLVSTIIIIVRRGFMQALIEIIALWSSIAATVYAFYPVNSTAAYLLLPHLGWVSFATYLTFQYWRLNPTSRAITDKQR